MKSIRYILIISIFVIISSIRSHACGPVWPDDPGYLSIFRCCSAELTRQWKEGSRFQDFERHENCLLWQKITSPDIPLEDIEEMVYRASLKDLRQMPDTTLKRNKFAAWLHRPSNREDHEYLLIAKEIEEIREYMNNPWYYPYEDDDEHRRLDELMRICRDYSGSRHTSRYALQAVRLNFASNNYQASIDLWEEKFSSLPKDIVTDMIASYVGGAYKRKGEREKAIELFTRSQDIGSLISLKDWDESLPDSRYRNKHIRELEYIFNRFPNSPLLNVKIQEFVRGLEIISNNDCTDDIPVGIATSWNGSSLSMGPETTFKTELKHFSRHAASSNECHQKWLWNYALAYMHYLDDDMREASRYLAKAENSECPAIAKESIQALRFMLNIRSTDNVGSLLKEMRWLDGKMQEAMSIIPDYNWQYDNQTNSSVNYWADVTRRLLSDVCPGMMDSGKTTLALQLANYASNRVYQLAPLFKVYTWDDVAQKFRPSIISFDQYRTVWPTRNEFDYQSQFFQMIDDIPADRAAAYAERIEKPRSALDRFLNERSYTDRDYIYDMVGTLYLREMNYAKAARWLSKVSEGYQARTNLAKEGYFRLDPFKYQYELHDRRHYINDSSDYKLRFAQEMLRLEKLIASDTEPNRKANAKIRYATGLRNSFGYCWYLTSYGWSYFYGNRHNCYERKGADDDPVTAEVFKKVDRLIAEAMKEFTDQECAAKAQFEMMNYITVMQRYPDTKVADYIRGHCDNLHDYAFERR